jgi:cytochrome b subunit of formate dehydrogenase
MKSPVRQSRIFWLIAAVLLVLVPVVVFANPEFQPITSASCGGCHPEAAREGALPTALHLSVHSGLDCLACHQDKATIPHQPIDGFRAGSQGCRGCHTEASEQYQVHGRALVEKQNPDIPDCASCHGSHGILSPEDKNSSVNPANLPRTCGKCHEDLNITRKYEILIDRPVQIYEASVHGRATMGGTFVAATCSDCHSSGGTAHRILAPNFPDSTVNFFNIPQTCGTCHQGVEQDYQQGIHGRMVANGMTAAPVCTSCHGEHGILPPSDPRSPVSPTRVSEITCARCHESENLNEKYGLPTGRLVSFVDSYHGLKSKAGDIRVANCGSCHGVHLILPSSDPASTINPDNLRQTCGVCHPGISKSMAQTPIHGIGGNGLHTRASEIVARIYQVAIVVIIGLMVIHWLLDLGRHFKNMFDRRPQIQRMHPNEVWQHMFLTVTFILLAISGFSLRYDQSLFARIFFGWEGGFAVRRLIHRVSAVLFCATSIWHLGFLFTARGRQFLKDMWPERNDFVFFWQQIRHNLGRAERPLTTGRFTYVEKAEYWALVWGAVVMIISGFMLWFDNWLSTFLPKGALDVALTIHFWEAWLATLAILVWHMYSVVFSPEVYPMNPSWLTGHMPEDMYREIHPGHFEQAKKETEAYLKHESELIHGEEDKQ